MGLHSCSPYRVVWLEQAAKISDNKLYEVYNFLFLATITFEGIAFSWFPEIGELV